MVVAHQPSDEPTMRTEEEIRHEIEALGVRRGRGSQLATDRRGVLRWVLGEVNTPPSAIVARE